VSATQLRPGTGARSFESGAADLYFGPTNERRPAWRRLVSDYGAAAGLLALVIVAWQVVVTIAGLPEYALPVPSEVATSLYNDWPNILGPASLTTLREVLAGFAMAVAGGTGIAVVLHLSGLLRKAVYPLLIASQTVPVIVLAPVLVVLFGFGIFPKLIVVGLICFFPIVVNGVDGLRSVDREYVLMMRTLHASRWAIFRRVEFPAALPQIFSGMRIAATYASIGAVFGEWAGSNAGLGYVMLAAEPNLLTARMFAAIVILSVIATLLFGTVCLAQRLLAPWSRGEGARR